MTAPDAAPAAEAAATVDVWVDYAQYYLADELDDLGQALQRLSGGGLVDAVPGLAAVYCGTHMGPVRVTVQVRPSAPPLDLAGWEDVAELSFTAPVGRTTIEEWGGGVHRDLPNLTPAGPGSYRLRLHGRGRDRGWEEDTPEEPVEEHLLAIWPAPPAPHAIHKLTSQQGQARAAQGAQTPEALPTVEPGFEPPPAAAPPWHPLVTTATAGIVPAAEPPEEPSSPDDQPPQQRNP
jgi:hypothetical protein